MFGIGRRKTKLWTEQSKNINTLHYVKSVYLSVCLSLFNVPLETLQTAAVSASYCFHCEKRQAPSSHLDSFYFSQILGKIATILAGTVHHKTKYAIRNFKQKIHIESRSESY